MAVALAGRIPALARGGDEPGLLVDGNWSIPALRRKQYGGADAVVAFAREIWWIARWWVRKLPRNEPAAYQLSLVAAHELRARATKPSAPSSQGIRPPR